jgi:hypothetical protein
MAEREIDTQQAIEDCLDLYAISKETVAYCLRRGGSLTDGRLIVTLFTCSDTCRATAEFIALEAELVPRAADFCADVCDYTADACERAGAGDEQLAAGADAARQCAESCRRLAALLTLPAEERQLRYD